MANLRLEINLMNYSIGGPTAGTGYERTYFDPTQYGTSTLTCYLEIVVASNISGNVTMTDGGSNNFSVPVSVTSGEVFLSQAISTPPAATYYMITPANVTLYLARLTIHVNTGASTTSFGSLEHQIEIGYNDSTASTTLPTGSAPSNFTFEPKYWYYDGTAWDGTITAYFEATFDGPTSKSAATIQLQVSDGTGNGFTGWTNVTNGAVTTASVSTTRVRSATAFTLTSGRWYRLAGMSPSSKSVTNLFSSKIIIRQSGTVTKCQPQYLMLHSLGQSPVNNLMGVLAAWNPADWSNVTNTYTFQAEVAGTSGASTSVINLVTADNFTTLATVSTPTWAGKSAISSMPAVYNLDNVYSVANGDISATRILVNVVLQAFVGTQVSPAAASMHITAGTPVVSGVATIVSPTKATLAISAKTSVIKQTIRPAPSTASMVISAKTPTVNIHAAAVTEMAMLI